MACRGGRELPRIPLLGKTDADIRYYSLNWTNADAEGGGRWGWCNSSEWGADTYITPVACSTFTNGNQRTATWRFRVKAAWAPASGQRLRVFAHDTAIAETGWLEPAPSYDVLRSLVDFDNDGDVDQLDFGHLQTCCTGLGTIQNDPACQDARLDGDTDVDQSDFVIFQACMSGRTCRLTQNVRDKRAMYAHDQEGTADHGSDRVVGA